MDGISAVGLSQAYTSSIQSTSQPQHRRHPGMDAAASLLGMSESDLRTAMQSGQSLSQIASSKGVSQDQLVSTIANAIQQANPNVSADRATAIATDMATRTRGNQGMNPAGGTPSAEPTGTGQTQGTSGTGAAGGHHHHHHHGMGAAMQVAATTLGVTTDQLTSSLKSGQSLSSLASAKGVSQDDLVKAMATALQGANSNLSADQATQVATGLATATPQSQPWAATGGTSSTFGVTA